MILGLVVVAGLVGDAVVVGVPPDPGVVPTLTGASISTVNDILHRQVGRGPGPFPLDVDSVCKGKKLEFVAGISGWLHIATGFETVSSSLNLSLGADSCTCGWKGSAVCSEEHSVT